MGGKGSGRRVRSIEEKRHAVIDKAWAITKEKLESGDKDNINTALPIVLKDLPNKEQVDMNARITQEEQSILDKYINPTRITSTES